MGYRVYIYTGDKKPYLYILVYQGIIITELVYVIN
jgi:hypothetical protein